MLTRVGLNRLQLYIDLSVLCEGCNSLSINKRFAFTRNAASRHEPATAHAQTIAVANFCETRLAFTSHALEERKQSPLCKKPPSV